MAHHQLIDCPSPGVAMSSGRKGDSKPARRIVFVGRYAYLNDRPAKGRDPVSGIDTTEKAINKDDKSDTITCSTVSSATQSTASRRGSSDEDAPTLTDATSVDGSSHDEPSTNKAS